MHLCGSSPRRCRTAALDGWLIKGGQAQNAQNVPLFFDTGKSYHTAWRSAFWVYVVGAPEVQAKLADGAKIAREQVRESYTTLGYPDLLSISDVNV